MGQLHGLDCSTIRLLDYLTIRLGSTNELRQQMDFCNSYDKRDAVQINEKCIFHIFVDSKSTSFSNSNLAGKCILKLSTSLFTFNTLCLPQLVLQCCRVLLPLAASLVLIC